MSSDIIANLQLGKQFSTSRLILAKEINGCDSSFITSSVLGFCIKNNRALLIINTHNTFSHYQNVGLKMNYNLQRYIENGLINFYDMGIREEINNLMSRNVELKDLFLKVKENYISMQEKYGSVNIIFDGISHLFDLQYTLSDVNRFCKDVVNLVRKCRNSFAIFHCNVASDDDVTCVLSNLLCHQAHTVVEVESLSSGWSADVSGHLNIRHIGQKFEPEHMCNLDVKPTKYLFKLFDRGVKLFAPGAL